MKRSLRDSKLIGRYLEGDVLDEADLSAEEREQLAKLEEDYLEDAALLDELMMRKAFKDLAASGEIERYEGAAHVADFETAKAKRGWPRVLHSPQYAAAASIAFATCLVLSGLLYVENRSLREGGLLIEAPVTRVVPLIQVRGAGAANELVQPGADELIVLAIDAGFEPYDNYRATVLRTEGGSEATVFERDGLVPGAYESVFVSLPGRVLEPGDYAIALAGRNADWADVRPSEPIAALQLTVTPR